MMTYIIAVWFKQILLNFKIFTVLLEKMINYLV